MDGLVGADAQALGAVDAELVDDAGLAVPDPDGPVGQADMQWVQPMHLSLVMWMAW